MLYKYFKDRLYIYVFNILYVYFFFVESKIFENLIFFSCFLNFNLFIFRLVIIYVVMLNKVRVMILDLWDYFFGFKI